MTSHNKINGVDADIKLSKEKNKQKQNAAHMKKCQRYSLSVMAKYWNS